MRAPVCCLKQPVRAFSLLLLLALALSGTAQAQSPQEWLQRMVAADRQYNYEGTMVHMCGGKIDVVRIVHRVDGDQVSERVTAQSAGGRQIIRNADEVMCILPDQKKVMVETGAAKNSSMGTQIDNFPSFSALSPSLYEVSELGSDRIAGRETVLLGIRPFDNHRYGYRLWLDLETGLPLKFELVNEKGVGLEHGAFTDIEFMAALSAEAVAPTVEMEGYEWQRSVVSTGQTDAGQLPETLWTVADPPAGYVLTWAESQPGNDSMPPMEQLVYSDGLASISIFIEVAEDDAMAVEGTSSIGATNAYSAILDGHLITAMGGVPPETTRRFAMSVNSR